MMQPQFSVTLHFMDYSFARIHKPLRITPDMAAGLSDHVWSQEEEEIAVQLNYDATESMESPLLLSSGHKTCRGWCRRYGTSAIPVGDGLCRKISLRNKCLAANSFRTRMNTAPRRHLAFFGITLSR